jgi:hypothetical protein
MVNMYLIFFIFIESSRDFILFSLTVMFYRLYDVDIFNLND